MDLQSSNPSLISVTDICTSDLCPFFKFSNWCPILKSMSLFKFSNRHPPFHKPMTVSHILKSTSNDITDACFKWRHNCFFEVFETIMETRQDQIPDEGSLMTKKKESANIQMQKHSGQILWIIPGTLTFCIHLIYCESTFLRGHKFSWFG